MRKISDKSMRWWLLFFCLAFYFVWLGIDGVATVIDTDSYVTFSMTREPVYPTILALFRAVFGQQNYFVWVGAFQCFLSGYVTWKVADVLTQKLKLRFISTCFMIAVSLGVELLSRFFSARKRMYCLEIGSEGIAIPLFLLFMTQLFLCCVSLNRKTIGMLFLYAVILICTRKQMYIVIPIMIMAWAALLFLKRITWKKAFILCIVSMLAFVASKGVDRMYNLIVRGQAIEHTTDSTTLLNAFFFVADVEDGAAIEDPGLRATFENIVMQIEEKQWGYKDAPDNWYDFWLFYAEKYDFIQFEILKPELSQYVSDLGQTDYIEEAIGFDEQAGRLLREMMFQNMPRKMELLWCNVFVGLSNTVAKAHPYLIWYTVISYLAYLVLWIGLFLKERQSLAVLFGYLVMMSIGINVFIVSIQIFSQSRYMIYNMALFYIALYLMIREFYLKSKKAEK